MPRRFRVPTRHRPSVALSMVCVVACVLSACTAGRAGSDARDNTLVVDTSFVYKTLDPGMVYEQTGYLAVHALYESLLTFHGGDVTEPKPGLAESYEASGNATRFTFTLREEAAFADGSPVTAADVEFSLERLVNLKGSASSYFEGLEVEAPDRRTVVVTSPEPNPNVPVLMAMPSASILNKDLVTRHGGTSGRDAASKDRAQSYLDRSTAGSGPYVLERNEPGEQLVLTANENYWGDAPAYPRVVVRAEKLLRDARITDPAIEFIYPAITYRGVDLGTIATKVQGDAAKAGITINLRPLPLNAFLEQYRGGNAQMGMTPQALTYPRADSMVRVMSPGGVNAERMNWTDDKASADVRSATQEFLAATTDEERATAVGAWQHAMQRDSPYVLLGNNSGTVVSTPEVTGAEYTPAGWIVDLSAVRPAG